MAKSNNQKPSRRQQKSMRMQRILFGAIAAIIIFSMLFSALRF